MEHKGSQQIGDKRGTPEKVEVQMSTAGEKGIQLDFETLIKVLKEGFDSNNKNLKQLSTEMSSNFKELHSSISGKNIDVSGPPKTTVDLNGNTSPIAKLPNTQVIDNDTFETENIDLN